MIRRLKQDDIKTIESMLRKVKNFNTEEIKVASELVNAAADLSQNDYNVFIWKTKKL